MSNYKLLYFKKTIKINFDDQFAVDFQQQSDLNNLRMEQGILNEILSLTDSSFKYILILFNFMTLIVVYIHKKKQKSQKLHNVLFITAHPDDQTMFFRPSISSITKDYYVHLLCLSGGQTQREQQLQKAGQKLKINKITCLKNQNFVDSIQSEWPVESIKEIVLNYVKQNNIKAIFTFDQFGVSNHPNHKAIYLALQNLHYVVPEQVKKLLTKKSLSEQQKSKIQQIKQQSIKIYHLTSVNILRKYSGFLQVFIALIRDYSWINLNFIDAYKTMSIHKTQFVWFRKLWVLFSQYSYINVYTMTRLSIKSVLKQENSSPQTNLQPQKQGQKIQDQQNKKQN